MVRVAALAATVAAVAIAIAWTWRRPVQWTGGWL